MEILNYATLVAALFFAFFTFVMLAEQMNLIRNNSSTIDKKKGESSRAHKSLSAKIMEPPS